MPVHNVRAYLRECVDSILTQSFRDFELLAIDDASPDGSGEILDEYAAADSRVEVIHLQRNVGLGRARDVGVDRATGRYLLFVDSDDSLTPGALAAMAQRIAETEEPDILIFDYARTFWNGRVLRNRLSESLTAAGRDAFEAEERPELLELLMVVWNKAYRRDFVSEHGFRFPPGYYEDLVWTYPTMITAERIAVLDQVCYHYRQRRHGNILRSQNRKHFDVLDQYRRVFDYVDGHPELEKWRAFLFRRMVSHTTMILTRADRVPRSLRREFFGLLVEAYRLHRPPDYTPPTGLKGLRSRAIAHDDYRSFQAAQFVREVKLNSTARLDKSQRTTKNRITDGKRALIRTYYRKELLKPIEENLAVYSAYWSAGYACNPAAIYEQVQRVAPHIRGVWVVNRADAGAMPKGVDYVELNSPAYYSVMARAKYFVNNVNFAGNIVKRPGTVHLQTQHGTPLKKMGLDLQRFPVGAARMNFRSLLERCDRWDFLLSANRFSTEVWERSYPSAYVTLETGYPRNDRLVRATADETIAMRRKLGLAEAKTIVLYAPTFRDWSRQKFEPAVDLADFCSRLGTDHTVLVRSHYFTGADPYLTMLEESGRLRNVSTYRSIEDLMIASDVLLTDYSSIMFDYANLERPIVIYANDWDTYKRVRGVNFDLLAMPPGVVEMTQDGLVDAFTSGRYREPEADGARKEFRRRFCEFDDGHAAERVVRRVFLGEKPSTSGHAMRATGVAQDEPDEPDEPDGDESLRSDVRRGSDDGTDSGTDESGTDDSSLNSTGE